MTVINLRKANHMVAPVLSGLAIMLLFITEAIALSVCVDPKTGRKDMREGGCGAHREVSRTRVSTVTERQADEDRAIERRAELSKEACDRWKKNDLDHYMNECATPEEKRVFREEMARKAEEQQRIQSEQRNREILIKAEQARQAAEAARQAAEAAKLASEAARHSADAANQAARQGKSCYVVGSYLHCN